MKLSKATSVPSIKFVIFSSFCDPILDLLNNEKYESKNMMRL